MSGASDHDRPDPGAGVFTPVGGILIAARGEFPFQFTRRFDHYDPHALHTVLASSRHELTRQASELVSLRPGGGSLSDLAQLIVAGDLAVVDADAERVTYSGRLQRRTPTEPPAPDEPPPLEQDWIEVELVNTENQPVASEAYRIVLTDGSVREGRLDSRGRVRFEEIDPGMCQVSFPDLRHERSDDD